MSKCWQGWIYIKCGHLLGSPAGSAPSHVHPCSLCTFHHKSLLAHFRNTTGCEYWSYGNSCLQGGSMDTPEILPLAKPLCTMLWHGMWSMTCPRRKGRGKAGKGKRKRSRMNESHKMLNMNTCMAGRMRLEAFVFACIWDKYDNPQPDILSNPSSVLQSSRGLTKPILGHVCDRRFVMKMFCYEKWAFSKSAGCDEDPG